MDFNPFVNWIEQEAADRREVFFVPDPSLLPFIYEKFGIKDPAIIDSEGPYIDEIRVAFVALWSETELERHNVTFNGKTVDGCTLLDIEKFGTTRIQFIDGFISKPHLNTFFKRAIKGNGENDKNPFNRFGPTTDSRIAILPDSKYLPTLYKALGVKNFAETNLTRADYDSAFEGTEYPEYDDILRVIYEDNPPIGIMWRESTNEGENIYLDSLPPSVVKRLAVRVANLQKAGQGKLPFAEAGRDVFSSIVRQDLKGKDLISLCRSNDKINAYCNQNDQQLFKQRLLSEFREKWHPGAHGYDHPRDLYVQMHKIYFDVFRNIRGDGYHLDKLEDGLVDDKDPIVRVVPYPKWSTGGSHHFLFFFPDHPELSFLYVDPREKGGEALRHASAVREVTYGMELEVFIQDAIDIIDSNENEGADAIAVMGYDENQEVLEWYLRLDNPEDRDFADDLVYIFSLDHEE